jgi:RNA polymerase sigma-70 factor (ECF subfamily)
MTDSDASKHGLDFRNAVDDGRKSGDRQRNLSGHSDEDLGRVSERDAITSSMTDVHRAVDTEDLLARANRGEPGAFDALIRHVSGRLLAIAHRMTANYPQVRRWEETDDILQESLLRMQRALTEVQPESLAGFFGLAATLLRRTLIDFSRHYYGAHGLGAKHQSGADWQHDLANRSAEGASSFEVLKSLEDWSAFHEAIGRLPDKEREVFGLLWYTGLSQRQVASLLRVSIRTIIRRMNRARLELYRLLQDSSSSEN